MNHQQPLNPVRTLLIAALLVGALGMIALPGAAASPLASSTLQNLPDAAWSTASTSQDWIDLIAGFGLLAALGLGLGGWWFKRRVLKFK